MSDFLGKMKEEAEKVWDEAKSAFENEALRENESLRPYHDLFAWADGSLLALPQAVQPDEKGMHTIAKMLIRGQNLVSPCDGTVVSIDKTSNTIVLKTLSGREIGVKVCVGAVDFTEAAQILVQTGQTVRVGQTLVHFETPIEARSKLFLINPDDSQAVASMKPEVGSGEVRQGDRLLRGAL